MYIIDSIKNTRTYDVTIVNNVIVGQLHERIKLTNNHARVYNVNCVTLHT